MMDHAWEPSWGHEIRRPRLGVLGVILTWHWACSGGHRGVSDFGGGNFATCASRRDALPWAPDRGR